MSSHLDCYPYLDALVGGWFHQDFDLDGQTLDAIITSYRTSTPPDDFLGTKADIQRFLRQTDSKTLAEDFQRTFEPGVDPTAWGMSVRDWLLQIYQLL